MLGRQALPLLLITFGFSLGARGADAVPVGAIKVNSGKPAKLAVRQVRQKDGSVVARLEMPKKLDRTGKGHPAPTLPPNLAEAEPMQSPRKIDQWLDAVTEPRVMSALATVAVGPSLEPRSLAQNIDPAKVRNWTEFVDPELYLRWMAGGTDPRFGQAIHNRPPMASPRWPVFPIQFPVPPEFQPGAPLKPTLWSNALEEGAGGQAASQEWLKLPMPDPKANPWLKASQHYRY